MELRGTGVARVSNKDFQAGDDIKGRVFNVVGDIDGMDNLNKETGLPTYRSS